MRKTPASAVDIFARHIIATLPADLRERQVILSTLIDVIPRSYEHMPELVKMREALNAHQVAQMKFGGILEGAEVSS